MKDKEQFNSRFDLLASELCGEIDYWKSEARYYKQLYEDLLKEQAEQSNMRLKKVKKGVADALMLALSVRDEPDGSLSISKDDRKELAKRL